MAGTITGKEFQGVIEGGAAAAGGYVWLTWSISNERQTVLIEQSQVGVLMSALSTVAGMAADERQRQGALEPNAAYALPVVSASPARSDLQARTAIIDLTVDAKRDKPWHLYLSADQAGLEKMRAAIDRALEMLNEPIKSH